MIRSGETQDREIPNGEEIVRSVRLVPLSRIRPAPSQPRSSMEQSALEGLTHNIRELRERERGIEGTGLLQPLIVRYASGAFDENGQLNPNVAEPYIIIAGETRYHACKAVGLEAVPVVIRDSSADDAFEDALFENIHRHDISPLDFARSLQWIRTRHDLSHPKLAARVSKPERTVRDALNLLSDEVGDDLRAVVDERPDSQWLVLRASKVRAPERRARIADMIRQRVKKDDVLTAIAQARQEEGTLGSPTITAPDTQTQQRAQIQEQQDAGAGGRGGSVSRGQIVTGPSQGEAKREAEAALSRARSSLVTAKQWLQQLPAKEREKLLKAHKGSLELALDDVRSLVPAPVDNTMSR